MQATNKSDATQVYEGAVKSSRTGAKGTLKYILKPLTIFGYHYFIEGIRAVQKDGPTKELEKITNLSYEETIKVMEKCQQDGVRVVATERTIAKEKLYKVINKHIREIRKGFNVGVSTSNDGDVTNIWKHQYRHWNFVSKYSHFDETLTKRGKRNKK